MKYVTYFLLLSSFLFSSCRQETDIIGSATIEAMINGVKFEAEVGNVIFLDGTLNMGGVGQYEALLQFNDVQEGTFQLPTSQGAIDVLFLTQEDGTVISVAEGSYTVSNLTNNRASGSFEGTFYATDDIFLSTPIQVTNGTFSASF